MSETLTTSVESEVILSQVRNYSKGITAKEIRKNISAGYPGLRKKMVNSALYELHREGLIERLETDGAPMWAPKEDTYGN